jgi:hypothetical protein
VNCLKGGRQAATVEDALEFHLYCDFRNKSAKSDEACQEGAKLQQLRGAAPKMALQFDGLNL